MSHAFERRKGTARFQWPSGHACRRARFDATMGRWVGDGSIDRWIEGSLSRVYIYIYMYCVLSDYVYSIIMHVSVYTYKKVANVLLSNDSNSDYYMALKL